VLLRATSCAGVNAALVCLDVGYTVTVCTGYNAVMHVMIHLCDGVDMQSLSDEYLFKCSTRPPGTVTLVADLKATTTSLRLLMIDFYNQLLDLFTYLLIYLLKIEYGINQNLHCLPRL